MHDYAKGGAEFDAGGQVGWKGLLEISSASGNSGTFGLLEQEPVSPSGSWVEVCCTAHTTPGVRRLVKQVLQGFKACQEPEAATDGMGGTYFLANESGRKAAILKPCDEEALAPNNPKGYVGRSLGEPGWKPTVRVGEAALREVAAYLLDHDHFSKVPHTVLVRAHHPILHYNNGLGHRSSSAGLADLDRLPPSRAEGKLGSLQEFVTHEGDTNDYGCSRFAKKDVHRIGILDIRLFNTDRHAGNILVRRPTSSSLNLRRLEDSQYELIPIDHGFCLPEALEAPHFEWLHWPQAMLPFEEDELRYIAELDSQQEAIMLQEELPNLRPQCVRILQLTTALLQRCAAAGLSLAEIGNIMTRPCNGYEEDASELERICQEARQALEDASESDNLSLDGGDSSGADSPQSDSESIPEEQLVLSDGDGDTRDPWSNTLGAGGLVRQLSLVHADGSCTMASVAEDEELLFEIEGEAGLYRTKSLHLGSSSPSSALETAGASLSLSSDGLECTAGPTSPIALARELRRDTSMARSMQDAGFMRHANMSRRHPVAKAVRGSPAKSTMRVYPPPVPGAAPQSVNDLFGDLEEEEWRLFMSEVEKRIHAALRNGCWKQAATATGGVAMSCPRF